MPIRLILSDHARVRMYERGYQIEHIKQAIRAPDRVDKQRGGVRVVRKTLPDKRTIEVICRQRLSQTNEYLIITVYYI